jgi:hypothetical protein
MLKKLRLNRADSYAYHIATYYMAEMIVNFLAGNNKYRSLGTEQGGVVGWDDIVMEHFDGQRHHLQVKRQETKFCDQPADRTTSKKKSTNNATDKTEPTERTLSPLDTAIESLATHFSEASGKQPIRKFFLEIPFPNILIKKEIEVRDFYSLCEDCKKSTLTANGLEERMADDDKTKFMFAWLTSWCGFRNWDHILTALGSLTIRYVKSESDLRDQTDRQFRDWFTSPEATRNAIRHYLDDNETDAGAATPRLMMEHVGHLLKSGSERWVQYQFAPNHMHWAIAGTLAGCGKTIQPAPLIVSELWNSAAGGVNILRLVSPLANEPLPQSLMRLALHLPGSSKAYFQNMVAWHSQMQVALAHTFGVDKGDLARDKFCWFDNDEPIKTPETRALEKISAIGDEATALMAEMDRITWDKVCTAVYKEIQEMTNGDMQAAVEALWKKWKMALATDESARQKLLIKMLHPTSEGEDVIAALRVGPRTSQLIAEGIIILLVVCAAIGDANVRWDNLGEKGSIATLALRQWGGVAGRKRVSRRFIEDDDDDVRLDILGKEEGTILIFSAVAMTQTEIRAPDLADIDVVQDSIASPHQPKLIVTNHGHFRSLIKKGDMQRIQDYLLDDFAKQKSEREKNIQAIGVGINGY